LSTTPIFETRKLTMAFGGLTAVDQVDLHLHAGETLGLIGPNGAGKTTFFNVISGIYSPTDGETLFCGEYIHGLKSHQVARRGMARTFQNNRLFWQLSILDNVLIGMHSRQTATLVDVLLRYGRTRRELDRCAAEAIDILRSFSPELADYHHRPVVDLPQGDRRRVEICRALASRPRLLLLDEPSAGMSPDETDKLMDDIDTMRRKFSGISVIIIEHDMAVIERIADRVVVFNFGRKLTEGTFTSISRDPAVIEAYLGEEDDA
jgi:branched-chain amino acid transport system ATP-binding protein